MERFIWVVIFGLFGFAGQVILYLCLGGDSVEIVGEEIKMFYYSPSFIVYAAIVSGGIAVLAGLLDIQYNWVEKIKKKFQPKVRFSFNEEINYSLKTNTKASLYNPRKDFSGKGERTFWVRLESIHSQTIQGCKLNVLSIIDVNTNKKIVNFVDSLSRRDTKNEVFPLRYGDPKDIDVVTYDETENDAQILVHYWRENRHNFYIPKGKYRFRLSAVGTDIMYSDSIRLTVVSVGRWD